MVLDHPWLIEELRRDPRDTVSFGSWKAVFDHTVAKYTGNARTTTGSRDIGSACRTSDIYREP